MCLNMMRRIIDELFGKFTIKLTPKKFNKKNKKPKDKCVNLTHIWSTLGSHVTSLVHLWCNWFLFKAEVLKEFSYVFM